jgi:hypothetical protein
MAVFAILLVLSQELLGPLDRRTEAKDIDRGAVHGRGNPGRGGEVFAQSARSRFLGQAPDPR